MGRGRPRKQTTTVNYDTIKLQNKLVTIYNTLIEVRDPADFGGHDYAYKVGFAKAGLEEVFDLIGLRTVTKEEGDEG